MTSASGAATLSLENELESAAAEEAYGVSAADDCAADEYGPSESAGGRRAYSGESESASEGRALDALLAEALVAREEMIALVGQERTTKARQLRALQRSEAKGHHRALCMSIADLAVDVGIAGTRREAQDLLRTGKHLERVPRIAAAFDAGAIHWTKARDVGPVLTPETEDIWLPRLTTWTNEQLLARVREDQGLPPVRRLSFCVTPDVGARYDQLAVQVRRSADRPLTDDEVFEEILQRALSGRTRQVEAEPRLAAAVEVDVEVEVQVEPRPAGEAEPEAEVVVKTSTDRIRPMTTVVIQRCEDCKRTTMEGRHGTVAVHEETYELMRCNSATLDLRDGPGRVTRTIPPKKANQVLARDHFRCCVPNCTNSTWIDIHHEGGRAVVGHDPDFMFVMCTFHHMELHRGHMRADTTGERVRFFRRDGVEIRAKGPAADLPHVGAADACALPCGGGVTVTHETRP